MNSPGEWTTPTIPSTIELEQTDTHTRHDDPGFFRSK